MERYANVASKVARRKSYEGILLTSLNIPGYYKQWQKMPGHPLAWQNTERQVAHKGRTWVADYVKKNRSSILDVGCGIGLDYDHYRDSNIRYLGVDITPKFVEAARQRGVPAEVGDVLNLQFKDGEFDTVYCKDLLIHLQPGEWRTALKEMSRVAKHEVITLEDRWRGETYYALREKHASHNEENNEFELLLFFHNCYGEADFRKHACILGLAVNIHLIEMNPPIISLDGIIRSSQITVYTKQQ